MLFNTDFNEQVFSPNPKKKMSRRLGYSNNQL